MFSLGCCCCYADLEANLGEDMLTNIANITVAELDNVGKFFASKPVSTLLHGELPDN